MALGWFLFALMTQSGVANPWDGTVTADHCSISPSGNTIDARFEPAAWPNFGCVLTTPQDWTDQALTFRVVNPGVDPVEFHVRIDDDPSADGVHHCVSFSGDADPGPAHTYVCRFTADPMAFGMRGLPPNTLGINLSGWNRVQTDHITRWQVFLGSPKSPTRLIISDVKLQPDSRSLKGVLDGFGQFTGADWPGKVRNVEQLRASVAEDRTWMPRDGYDVYGGWETGPHLQATGRFRTQQVDGKWWFVTPEGRLFFSLGVDCVGYSNPTIVTGREEMFADLPDEAGPMATLYGQDNYTLMGPMAGKKAKTYDFFGANRMLKYGDRWQATAAEVAVNRLHSWGFNTIGNWSNTDVRKLRKMPYVATVSIWGVAHTVNTGSDYWGAMPDVFDPGYPQVVAKRIQEQADFAIGDPWCLGWFIDNEMSWSGTAGTNDENGRFGLAYGALAADAGSPAKSEFIRELKAKYGDIQALNNQWLTSFASWEALDTPVTSFAGPSPASRRGDLAAFCLAFANRYFETMRTAIRDVDPQALYFGCRFAGKTPEAEQAAARYCDVISYNIYARRPDAVNSPDVAKLGKPVIIGEFHFGATDRGMFHPGLGPTLNQKARAQAYGTYVDSALASPDCVGCHWFQYLDEPTLGRTLDGENYNIGFVNVADNPYPELVRVATATNLRAYGERFGPAQESR
jgi:hypothetical protein